MLGDVSVQVMAERARLAEAVGYGTVWLADERFYREVYSCLAHFAARTSKVLLGPCVTDPFSRHPALTAMAIATLDEISGQRAILGIGASGFTELGINRRRPARAIREMIEVIRALLLGESIDFHGEVIEFHQGGLSFVPTRGEPTTGSRALRRFSCIISTAAPWLGSASRSPIKPEPAS